MRRDEPLRLLRPCAIAAALACAAVMGLAVTDPVYARDLGVIGPVYPIAEQDMVKEIETILREKQASGELARIESAARQRVIDRITTPIPVAGVRTAQVKRTYSFDPSVKFDEAIRDDKGRVILPAGTLANPLSVVSLRSELLFVDARDPRQVRLAKAELDRSVTPLKVILTAGSPIELSRLWKKPVFFDQGGQMVQRFGIAAVPARVRQDGMTLLIQEFPPQ